MGLLLSTSVLLAVAVEVVYLVVVEVLVDLEPMFLVIH